MKSQMIEGATRICGKGQGYLGLAIRDELINDPVNGPDTPQMVTSWEVFPDEIERLRAGAPVILSILGRTPPPLLIGVGEAPDEHEARVSQDQTALHNAIAGRIVASIIRPVIAAGGDYASAMVLLESVIMGVVLAGVKLGGDERILDQIVVNIKARLAQERLSGIEPKGKA